MGCVMAQEQSDALEVFAVGDVLKALAVWPVLRLWRCPRCGVSYVGPEGIKSWHCMECSEFEAGDLRSLVQVAWVSRSRWHG